jgi:hypothetical protein
MRRAPIPRPIGFSIEHSPLSTRVRRRVRARFSAPAFTEIFVGSNLP